MQTICKVYLAGDSTMCSYGESVRPRAGWGEKLGELLVEGIQVCNHASSGRSSKSFIHEGRLAAIEESIREGDYLFIQFGHNDEKPDEERHTDPYTTFPEHLRRYVDAALSRGAHPVLITPVQRRSFDENGSLRDTHGDYPDSIRQSAAEWGVPLVDLSVSSWRLFEELGPAGTKELLLWLEPGEHPNYPDGVQDDTHFCEKGAARIAGLVADGLRQLGLSILK